MHTHHAPSHENLNTAFKAAVILNTLYVLIEASTGFATGSLALLADAAHNLTDVAGLLMAWGAAFAARQSPNGRFTYGYGRSTIMAALVNAVVIMLGVGAVIWEAVHRLSQPVFVSSGFVILVALLGIAVNGGTALFFRASRHHDLNAKGAFLHMMGDAGVSLGVVLATALAMMTGWRWLDPAVAIGVSLLVALATYDLLRTSFCLILDSVPTSIDPADVQTWLTQQKGVTALHDLHIWALSTTMTALTAHLVMKDGHPGDAFLHHLVDELEKKFKIHHATFQIETDMAACCACDCHAEEGDKQ